MIDYLGAALLALATTSLVLMTSLGGTTYAWGSAPITTLGVAGVLLIALFVAAERRATEPVLPLRLFSNRVFSFSGALAFVVGFAMFGAITFLPLYLQVVRGVNPTVSGLRLLPIDGRAAAHIDHLRAADQSIGPLHRELSERPEAPRRGR